MRVRTRRAWRFLSIGEEGERYRERTITVILEWIPFNLTQATNIHHISSHSILRTKHHPTAIAALKLYMHDGTKLLDWVQIGFACWWSLQMLMIEGRRHPPRQGLR